MNDTSYSIEQLNFMNNMEKFKQPDINFTTFKMVYKSILKYFNSSGKDEYPKSLYFLVKKEYEIRAITEEFSRYSPLWIVLWCLICFVGVIGNGFVILVFSRSNMRVVYEIFCIGLAVTDLSFLILVVPVTVMHYVMQGWVFGHVMCRIINYIAYGTMFCSGMMLLSLTTSRYLAVVRPWDHRNMTIKGAVIACCIACLIGYICAIPIVLHFDIVKTKRCQDNFPSPLTKQLYFAAVLVFSYLLPFIGIITMNCKIALSLRKDPTQATNVTQKVDQLKSQQINNNNNDNNNNSNKNENETNYKLMLPQPNCQLPSTSKRQQKNQNRRSKVTKLVIVVTTAYCLCWLPTQLLNAWYYISPMKYPHNIYMLFAKSIAQTFSYAAAGLNPFIYSFISKSFQACVKTQFPRLYSLIKRISIASTNTSRIFHHHNRTAIDTKNQSNSTNQNASKLQTKSTILTTKTASITNIDDSRNLLNNTG